MSKLRKVEPKPFGRIDLVAMSKKEHDSIGDWALQQKRRRQLNELQLKAYRSMPNPVTKEEGRSDKYKELRFYERSKIDMGVLLKSVFQLAERGISDPKLSSVSVKHEDSLVKVNHTDEYGHVLELDLARVVEPKGTIHFRLNYLHSYYVQNPTNVLSVRLEELYSFDSEVHFRLAYSVCSKIYRESPVLLNYVLSSVEDLCKSSLGGVSTLEKAKQDYTIMYDVQSKGKWSMW